MTTKSRAKKPDRERRVYSGPISIRKAGDKRTIFGYATKFSPVQSADLGGFVEEIHPNAFDACLRSAPDVVGLWNHDTNHVLGRTTSGTLRLSTDKVGLKYQIDPPDTQTANDLMELMDRGDIHQSSFGFYCVDESWREGQNGVYIRTVLKAELFDVSPVTFPAYPDATSGVRGALRNAPDAIRAAIEAKSKRDEDYCGEDQQDEDGNCPCDDDYSGDDDCRSNSSDTDAELDTLRLRLKLHQHRANHSLAR